MKFKNGDIYIYQGLQGETVLWLRVANNRWTRPTADGMAEAMDYHIEDAINYDVHYKVTLSGIFIRGGKVLDAADLT